MTRRVPLKVGPVATAAAAGRRAKPRHEPVGELVFEESASAGRRYLFRGGARTADGPQEPRRGRR